MSFKDLSKGNQNTVTSNESGDIELRSEKNISLYPGSLAAPDTLGGDKLIWIRDGAKLVFEGRIPDDFEAKLYADALTADREIVLQDKSGTVALLADIQDALADATVSYTNTTPMPTGLGGFPAGQTFNDMSIEDVLTGLLYPYQYPTFTNFSISGMTTTLEVGDSISAGDYTFSWNTTNSSNINPSSVEVADNITGQILGTGLVNDGSELLTITGAITKTSPILHSWSVKATNTQGIEFTRTTSASWKWRVYHGSSNSEVLDAAGVQALTENSLQSNFSGNKTFSNDIEYKWMAYPTSMGLKTNFFDQATGFGVAMETAYTLSITNAFGVATDYYVHRTVNKLSSITIGIS